MFSNEFDLGEQYAPDYAADPAGAQQAVNSIRWTEYLPGPYGLGGDGKGNDDLGGISSQFIWEMLGFYPENPGSDVLVFASPGFPRAVIRLANGHTITIDAPGASQSVYYVHGLTINGAADQRLYTTLARSKAGPRSTSRSPRRQGPGAPTRPTSRRPTARSTVRELAVRELAVRELAVRELAVRELAGRELAGGAGAEDRPADLGAPGASRPACPAGRPGSTRGSGPSTCRACSATYAASAPYERSTSCVRAGVDDDRQLGRRDDLRGDPADERDLGRGGHEDRRLSLFLGEQLGGVAAAGGPGRGDAAGLQAWRTARRARRGTRASSSAVLTTLVMARGLGRRHPAVTDRRDCPPGRRAGPAGTRRHSCVRARSCSSRVRCAAISWFLAPQVGRCPARHGSGRAACRGRGSGG